MVIYFKRHDLNHDHTEKKIINFLKNESYNVVYFLNLYYITMHKYLRLNFSRFLFLDTVLFYLLHLTCVYF